MEKLKFFFLLMYFIVVVSYPIELESFTEVELEEGKSEYIYNYTKSYSYTNKTPVIYFKIITYGVSNIKIDVHLNKGKIYNYIVFSEIWCNIPLDEEEESINITLKIESDQKNAKMIFMDASKIIKISLTQLFNLNLWATMQLSKEPIPLLFNITADTNIYFSTSKNEKYSYSFLDSDYMLTYFSYEENKDWKFKDAKNVHFIKDKTYILKYNCYKDDDIYIYRELTIDYYIEEVFIKNNTFIMHNFTDNNYILLNYHYNSNIYFYINDNSEFEHEYYKMSTILERDFNTFIKSEKKMRLLIYNKVINGKINYLKDIIKDKKETYLIIKINNKNDNYHGFITFFTEKYEINEQNWSKEINKGIHALIYINNTISLFRFLTSSNQNMKLLYNYQNNFTNTLFLNIEKENIIYIDSSQENTILFGFFFNNKNNDSNKYNYNFFTNSNINDTFNRIKSDTFFNRRISNNIEPGFYSYYFFDIQEEYYIYTKKYFGKINLFKYNKPLDLNISIQDFFMKPISYYDVNKYKIVNNELLILSGTQFFNYYINSGSFFDLFIQRVNDNNYIEININTNKYSKNTVKMLNDGKQYYIKFELNHLIKLDNKFLDAEVYFYNNEGIQYTLNNKNKIIYIKGNNYMVKSNKTALVYFYEKIINYNDKSVIEFDKSQTGKNMKINISNKGKNSINIVIIKDFGFKEYYPLMNYEELEIMTLHGKKMINLYIENYYDILESDIYESNGEKYYIYLFEINLNNELSLLDNRNINIHSPSYFDSITKLNKLNFEIIPKGNNNLLLKSSPKFDTINYQFIKCSNNNITYNLTIQDNFLTNIENHIITSNTISKKKLDKNPSLIYSFESQNEFLFLYDFSNDNNNTELHRLKNFGIKYLNINMNNILYIGFNPVYTSFSEFYIIIARKDEINNLYSFSDPCYLTKLITKNPEEIVIKKVYHSNETIIFEKIDINKIVTQNSINEYVINIISINLIQFNHFDIYNPMIYNINTNNKNIMKLKLFDNILFKPNNDLFVYEHLTEEKLTLYISIFKNDYNDVVLILRENNENTKIFYNDTNDLFEITLEKKGYYYLEFIYIDNIINDEYISIRCYAFNKMIDEIDLSKNNYYGFFHISKPSVQYQRNNLSYYKVTNIKQDTEIYFAYDKDIDEYKYLPFTICTYKTDNCRMGFNPFTFYFTLLKGVNYIIYVDLLNRDIPIKKNVYSFTYSFFPITDNFTYNIEQNEYSNFNTPRMYIFENKKDYLFKTFNIIPNFICTKTWLPRITYYNYNGLSLYDIYRSVYTQCSKVIFVPENNNKSMQLFVENKNFQEKQMEIQAGTDLLITIEDIFLYSFVTFSSPVDNIRFVSFDNSIKNKSKKFIMNNYKVKYLYVDKSDKDIIINKTIYDPKYLFFTILNDETLDNFKSFLKENNIYINSRINTDNIKMYDFINIYIDKLNEKYNLYIKKYYGQIQLYESQYELNDIENNIDILTKPINNLENKQSLFNRLIQLNKNQLITGFVSANSLLDIYVEQDKDNKDIYITDFKNRKYLKKDIEYHFHFYLNHLIKIEPQFDAEIIIYNEDTKIIINNKIQTGIIIGNNYKIKSNEDVMIYFYPKIKKFQKLINPEKGQIIEIKKNNFVLKYSIDFGFEGFEPPNIHYFDNKKNKDNKLYIENIYDKLEIKLTEGEYLYIYYDSLREDDIEINYINDSTIHTNYKYNFLMIKKNMKNKLYISNLNKINTHFIIKRNDQSVIKFHKGDEITKKYRYLIEFDSEDNIQYVIEPENDYILNYDIDDYKKNYKYKSLIKYDTEKWEEDRMKLNNLTINNISLINENKIKIDFNTNYKNSLTKYIIMITPEEKDNTFENMKNIFYVTELINQKDGNFIIEEYYDIGEDDFIEITVDISKLEKNYKKYFVNIISKEIRFRKGVNFYEPKFFYSEKNAVEINIKIIILIVVFAVFSVIIYKYLKKWYKKINFKKEQFKRFNKDFGVELNAEKEMINN